MFNGEISKRTFLKTAAAAALAPTVSAVSAVSRWSAVPMTRAPNVVLICTDDLGSGDLGCYGSGIPTPYIDQMAREGVRLHQYNAAAPVCSPSRAALLTGRYPARSGVTDVCFPADPAGISCEETTIAQMLKGVGYNTMLVGKWHLGSQPLYLPTNHGFDEFYGLAYSHDMSPLPLLHNTDVIEDPVNLSTLAPRLVEQSIRFMARSGQTPFFLYLAHFLPHIPIVSSAAFSGKSAFGPYGDAVQEIDSCVGQILGALKDLGIDQNTLVMFTSDHGPWYQGSNGLLRGRKGETFEGGVRVPMIARFPGQIPRGLVSRGVASNMDVLPTLARLCGAPLPAKPADGVDIWPLLTGQEVSRDILLYFDSWHIQCARIGMWKLHVARYNSVAWGPAPPGGRLNLPLLKPELYNLESDPGESFDVSAQYPELVTAIRARIEALLPGMPTRVISAWADTHGYKVAATPAGAITAAIQP